jgi:hypothetical protein
VWPTNWVEPHPSTKQGVAYHFELSHTHEKNQTKTLPRKVITKSKQMMVIFLTSICVMPYRDGLRKGCAIHLWVKPRPYEKAKQKLFSGKSYFTKSKQITIIVLIKKD